MIKHLLTDIPLVKSLIRLPSRNKYIIPSNVIQSSSLQQVVFAYKKHLFVPFTSKKELNENRMRNELNASKVGVDTVSFKNIVYILGLGQKNNVDVTRKAGENVFHLGGQKNFFCLF